jgi:hypothetical protein
MAYTPPQPVPLWPAFFPSAPVVPKLYFDALSPEQRMKKLCEELHRLCDYANTLGVNINLDHELIAQLQNDFQTFVDSGFEDHYEEQIHAWVLEHMPDIIRDAIRMVFFGLTMDGYFCAWIPESWSDIWFDTGANYNRSDYGCLMILFDAAGTGDFSYVSDFDTLEQMIHAGDAALSARLDRTEHTLYTDVSEGGE